MEQVLFRKNPELQTDQKILVAVSTGVDSMVLLHLLEQAGLSVGVAHVDHQLRAESKDEAEFLRDYCKRHKLPFYLNVWQQPAKKNIEASARKVRYDFFEEIMEAENYSLLVTAHHGDDQLETMVMRLAQGGSLASHSGIARKQIFGTGSLLRPLLSFSKAEIYHYAEEKQITYFEDITNQSTDFFRNRMRHNVIPELKKENPQILQHVQQFQQQLTWAEPLIKQALKENLRNIRQTDQGWSFSTETLPDERGARYYFLTSFFQDTEGQTGLAVSQRQIFGLLDQIQRPVSQWTLDLGKNWLFARRYQQFSLEKKPTSILNEGIFSLVENQTLTIGGAEKVTLRKSMKKPEINGYHVPLPLDIELPLTIRRRQPGDRMRFSATLKKRINRYFIDQKIPADKRNNAWVVEDSLGEIVALLPFANSYLSIAVETDRIHYILDYMHQVSK
ncbi:tRNA lysidine(34) synthetase TilS [Enterococcus viikkiensis]|uniref:tRNA lysidine(34) synthetase TilS n=1 Tax=Enterococcus viikkiensis TaxID=930854 RepID=UPI0010F89561|nr:tRNA lysidine(34) synthetase TilS [Enterococcus viikkiensis]